MQTSINTLAQNAYCGNSVTISVLPSGYNGFGRMNLAVVGENIINYEYDCSGIRVAKNVNGCRTELINDGDSVIAELCQGEVDNYYRGLSLIGYEADDELFYYRLNAHGDTIGIVDGFGNQVKTYSYDAFGNQEYVDEFDANPFGYCGEYFDNEIGLIYLRARYYDPSVQRFVSEDPICDSVNWYVYCKNSPINASDPTGLFAITGTITAAIFAEKLVEAFFYTAAAYLTAILVTETSDFISEHNDRNSNVHISPMPEVDSQGLETVPEQTSGTTILVSPAEQQEKVHVETLPTQEGRNNSTVSLPQTEQSKPSIVISSNKVTTPELTRIAKELGYEKTSHLSNGEVVYYNRKDKTYITHDNTGHSGGFWKMATSPEKLANKSTRMGTYTQDLKRIGD